MAACFALLLRFYDNSSFIYISKVSIIGKNFNDGIKQVGIDLYRWGIGIVGCAFVALLVWIIYGCCQENLRWIAYIGQKSMGIYIISGYMNSRVLARLTQGFQLNYGLAVIETVIMIAMNLIIIKIINMNKVSSRLLLGSR